MTNLTIINEDLPDFLQSAGVSALTKQLAGKTGVKRIVPKNGIFRKTVGGEEMGKVKGNLDVIIVNASPAVGRIFYAKAWSPDAEPTAPDCFSNDGRTPDAGAENPQSERCDNCQQNIKGSGMGNSKSCRYSRRIAMVLKEDFGTSLEGEVYQMNLASKSLFGEGAGENTHTFENYSKYLSNNGKILFENYSNPFVLRDLIDLGSVSSLRPTIGTKHPFSMFEANMTQDEFYNLYRDMTTFYGRDRGEGEYEANYFKDYDDFLLNGQQEMLTVSQLGSYPITVKSLFC